MELWLFGVYALLTKIWGIHKMSHLDRFMEYATFSGNAIQRLEDVFDDGSIDVLTYWMQAHGESLG